MTGGGVARASVAAVILAQGAMPEDASIIAEMVAAARDAGCDPLIAVLPRGMATPDRARATNVAAGASAISAIRAGMAQLGNSSVRHALLWPHAGDACDPACVHALVHFSVATGATIAALDGADLDHSPVVILRDAWLDLMTLGERGIGALAARHDVQRLSVE